MRRASSCPGIVLTVLALLAVTSAGCLRPCVPSCMSQSRQLVDLANPFAEAHLYDAGMSREVAMEFRRRAAERQVPGGRPYHCLALSGGGVYGAFGIGMLNGWTESGQRPEFDVVTGISTGALIATFAFLGSEHDALLTKIILDQSDQRDLMRRLPLVMMPISDSLYSSRPLVKQIRQVITPQILREVAAAHAAGRRLYVGTSNLDTRQLVIWDLGAIASAGTDEALELYRNVVLASSSVPGALPAVRIKVEVDGKCYEEMHVDGGVTEGILFRGLMIAEQNRIAGRPGPWAPPGSVLYAIDNGKLYADPECVKPQILNILSATAGSVLHGKTRDELRRMYVDCLATGTEFRLTAVPQDLKVGNDALRLKREERVELFEAGRRAGREAGNGMLWQDQPPTDVTDQTIPRGGVRFVTRP